MQLSRQFALFVIMGALATGTHILCLTLLVELSGWPPVSASCIGAIAGALVSYWLNYHHTFRSTRPHQAALSRFLIVAVVAFIVNGALLAGMLRSFGPHYLLAQVLTTLIVLIFTFSAGRLWAFR
ncbi:MAG: GtrA family protein [Casimicrobiaceae bacterium]